MQTIRFGILGAGAIAGRWMKDAHTLRGARVTCVASRNEAKARAFADAWGIPKAVGSYEDLVASLDVDVVYVATPHPLHRQHALLAMRAGKHVLCEKPAALNQRELRDMLACAQANGVFFMEAMWTRFFPGTLRVKELLAQGAIGRLCAVQAQFSFRAAYDPANRLFAPGLGGGALLDVGCYPISYAVDMFGAAPASVAGVAHIGPTGVDEQNAISLRFPGGGVASLVSGLAADMPVVAALYGEEGCLTVPDFYHPERVLLTRAGHTETVFDQPYEQEGFAFEVEHAADCVRQGLAESPRMPHSHSLAVMAAMDALRARWGLVYPTEDGHA
ncbi:MAG: Gfo/Idh/MocA family oxidoreductase [Oscillospiraceae bacterium]|nr:Gfo/Idh/MocA family oxidoreductase [Oscillospiraceae bacterium]